MKIYITKYSPCTTGNTCDCPVEMGGPPETSFEGGVFKEINGRIRWQSGDGKKTEDWVFAQEKGDPIIAQADLNKYAVVVPGFNNNSPIFIRDRYGKQHGVSNFLDLFAPCPEYDQAGATLQTLAIPGEAIGEDNGIPIMVSIVDTTKPIGSSNSFAGGLDFRSVGPSLGPNDYVGLWKSIDEVFAALGDPNKSESTIQNQLVDVTFMGVRLTINKKIIGPLKLVEADIKASDATYKIRQGKETGAYNWRQNENDKSKISPHATGLAIDINANTNPNQERASGCKPRDASCCPHDIPKAVSGAFEKNGFFWGAKFDARKPNRPNGLCDSMHFQYGGNY